MRRSLPTALPLKNIRLSAGRSFGRRCRTALATPSTRLIGERENDALRLEEAVAAYRAALTERRLKLVPHDWATTKNNLGGALESLGRRENDPLRVQEAISAYRDALTVLVGDVVIQNNLKTALSLLRGLRSRPRNNDK